MEILNRRASEVQGSELSGASKLLSVIGNRSDIICSNYRGVILKTALRVRQTRDNKLMLF